MNIVRRATRCPPSSCRGEPLGNWSRSRRERIGTRAPAARIDPGHAGRRRIRGLSLSEIMLASLIMALALLPVAGLITRGLGDTDVSVSYTTAMELAQSTLNELLNPTVRIPDIPLSATPSFSSWDNVVTEGSVASDAFFDGVIPESRVENGRRIIDRSGIQYFVDIWTGVLANAGDLTFRYYLNPQVRYDTAPLNNAFYLTRNLGASDFSEFSPYNPNIPDGRVLTIQTANGPETPKWAQNEVVLDQSGFSNPDPVSGSYMNVMKVIARVTWRRRRSGAATDVRAFWLITYKTNL